MLSALLVTALAAAPPLLIATQAPGADVARIGVAAPDGFRELARLNTLPDMLPRGVVLADGKHAAVAVVERRDWSGSLYLVDLQSSATERLADDVFAQERPRAMPDGRVVFTRVAQGEQTAWGELAEASTTIFTVRPGEAPRALAALDGHGANLAGTWRGEVLAYRVTREGASIWRVPASGEPTRVAKLPHGPFARDFNVVGDALVYATATGLGSYALERLDLRTGAIAPLLTSRSDHLAPLATRTHVVITDENLHASDSHVPILRGRAFGLAASGETMAARLETPMGEHLMLVDSESARELPTDGEFEVLGFEEPAR